MPSVNEINTAVYNLLAEDVTLVGLCSLHKGGKRPSHAKNPSVTLDTKRLERGEGEGIWMCDIVVTSYADMLPNNTPDHNTHETLLFWLRELLADTELTLTNAKALPLIEGESMSPVWVGSHAGETLQEMTYGLIFVHF